MTSSSHQAVSQVQDNHTDKCGSQPISFAKQKYLCHSNQLAYFPPARWLFPGQFPGWGGGTEMSSIIEWKSEIKGF